MAGLLDVFKMSLEGYRKDLVASILFGLGIAFLRMLNLIPILGAFIMAYLGPRLWSWYYNKTIGNINTDLNVAFSIWLKVHLILHIIYIIALIFLFLALKDIFMLMSAVSGYTLYGDIGALSNLSTYTYFFAILLLGIILLVIYILFIYTLYGSILGKVTEFKIYPEKSAILFIYAFVWGFVFGIINGILGVLPFIGGILSTIFLLFFAYPMIELIIANKAKEL